MAPTLTAGGTPDLASRSRGWARYIWGPMEILEDRHGAIPQGVATAVSVGAYDGIHRGHQQVLSTLVKLARERELEPAVVTFDQHPVAVLRPEEAPLMLTDQAQRVALFDQLGIDWLYLLSFDQDRAETTAREFVAQVLVGALRAKLVVVGSNFHFGKGRTGSVDSLRELGREFGFEVVDLDLLGEVAMTEPISSTAIRAALADGDIASVNAMLGRSHEIRGEVIRGDRRGNTIGFPTANIAFEPGRAWPAVGVYAAWAVLADGRRVPAAVNIGIRPTFHDQAERPVLEAHLIGFDEDLYGQRIGVEFVARLRDERRFETIEELVAQLQVDVAAVVEALGE